MAKAHLRYAEEDVKCSGKRYCFDTTLIFERETDVEVAVQNLLTVNLLFAAWRAAHDGTRCWNLRDGSDCPRCQAKFNDKFYGSKIMPLKDRIDNDPLFKKEKLSEDKGFDPLAF